MNERIRELAEQAMSATFNKFSGVEWSAEEWRNFYDTKFAELIAAECANVLQKEIKTAIAHDGKETHIDLILIEHFGVEE